MEMRSTPISSFFPRHTASSCAATIVTTQYQPSRQPATRRKNPQNSYLFNAHLSIRQIAHVITNQYIHDIVRIYTIRNKILI